MNTESTQTPESLGSPLGSASSCCGSGVRVVGGRDGTNWHECRLCGKPCDAVACDGPACPVCRGPMGTNFDGGNGYDYCWEHGEANP
jgi:hypothetical protein